MGFSTTTTNFDKTVVDLVSRKVIATLRAGLLFLPPGAIVPAVQKSGGNGTFVHTAYPDLPVFTTDLAEGVPPVGQELGIDTVEYQASQKGNFVKVTDLAKMQSPHNLATIASDKIARQMAMTADELAKTVWATHAADIFSGTGNSATADIAAGDILDSVNVMDGVALLRANDVEPFPNGDYLAITHPYALRGLQVDRRFVTAASYGDPGRLFKGSVGGFEGVQLRTSSRAISVAGTGITVYRTIIIGKNSIAFGDIGTLEVITEHGGVSDPLHQLETVGWKAYLGGTLVKVAEGTDGAGNNGSAVDRMVAIESASGVGEAGA